MKNHARNSMTICYIVFRHVIPQMLHETNYWGERKNQDTCGINCGAVMEICHIQKLNFSVEPKSGTDSRKHNTANIYFKIIETYL